MRIGRRGLAIAAIALAPAAACMAWAAVDRLLPALVRRVGAGCEARAVHF